MSLSRLDEVLERKRGALCLGGMVRVVVGNGESVRGV